MFVWGNGERIEGEMIRKQKVDGIVWLTWGGFDCLERNCVGISGRVVGNG
jgi:hypothetical protein